MKLAVIGFGQCGNRIADEFARLNNRAKNKRGFDICVGVYAVNTDSADLAGLATIKSDYQHRILMGAGRTHGHGVAKLTELGAEIAREDGDKVIDAIKSEKKFYDADAIMVIGGAAGGTGSGVMPVMAKMLKERFTDKPVYALVVLPFDHESVTEERTPYNTALCLKSTHEAADAVFLVDNQRYVRKDASIVKNINMINQIIVEPFYNLLCSGEETKKKYIGARMIDTGDIISTACGWSSVGYGSMEISRMGQMFGRSHSFSNRSEETQKGMQVFDAATSELSIDFNPNEAGRVLFLLTGPSRDINVDMVKEISDGFKDMAPDSQLRMGDYPRGGSKIEISVLVSELADVPKVKEFYRLSKEIAAEFRRREKEREKISNSTADAAKDVPTLFD